MKFRLTLAAILALVIFGVTAFAYSAAPAQAESGYANLACSK